MNDLVTKTNYEMGSYRWAILSITTFTQATIAVISQGIGTLAPFLVIGLGLSKTQVGFAGGAVNVGMILTAFLAGRAVDMWGEKKVLVMGGLTTGCAIFLTSLSNSFTTLIALLMFTGLWAGSSTPAGSKAIMAWFPFSQRALALGIRQTGVPLGGLVAALIIPPIATYYGWQMAMVTMGAGAIFGALVCQSTYRNHPLEVGSNNFKKGSQWTYLLRNKNIWLVGVTGITFIAGQFIIVTYLVLYLHDKTGQSVAFASRFLALAQFGGMVGRIFWGYISDTFFLGKRKPVLGIIGIIAAGMALVMLFISETTSIWVVGLAAWTFGFTAVGWNGVYITLLSEMAGKDHAGTAVGIGVTLLQLGVLTFPPAFGLLVDRSGSYETSWISLSALMVLGVLILILIDEKKIVRNY